MTPSPRIAAFRTAARTARDLVSTPEVGRAWDTPSALPLMSIGELSAHLLGQILATRMALRTDTSGREVIGVRDHYRRVTWRGAPLDDPTNQAIRQGATGVAAPGQLALLVQAGEVLDQLDEQLPTLPSDQPVAPPWVAWALPLDDFLLTRLLEITVHLDDLAVSVGQPTPALSDEVAEPVRHLLVDLASERHGDVAVVRALARAERAPDSIAAM